MPPYQTLLYETTGGVATLTLNRPDRMNGMTSRMVREAHEVLTEAAADDSLSVLVLTGAGGSFCPGADLKGATSRDSDFGTADAIHFQVPVLLHRMPAITVAAINGACAGAGFGWACSCDLRVAARSAMFNTAFLAVAVAGDMGLPWSLPRLVGAAKARELSFFSEKFSSEPR
jgi:2-(1,2-epoxy-1,2-dihydrophenyl)acetyl-CoA isomerase